VYDGVDGKEADKAAELLDCYADTINKGDCSSGDLYLTTVSEITSCLQ
jgi:hypothetical protein